MVNDEANNIYRIIPSFKHEDQNTFPSMVHMALQILGDILPHLKPDRVKINDNRAIVSIPGSLYMFLNVLLGDQNLLEWDDFDDDKKEAKRCSKIVRIAQDLMFTASEQKFLTPKHVGMATTFHQATH